MTAIASIYTPEGFVIGADGRQLTYEMDSIESDSATKIFGFAAENVRGAYAWTGSIRLTWGASVFDFKNHSSEIVNELESETSDSLKEYVVRFCLLIYEHLKSWIENSGAKFPVVDNPEMVRVRFVGFANGLPDMKSAYYPLNNGIWTAPGLGQVEPPIGKLNIFGGNEKVFLEMDEKGLIHACSTLAEGKALVAGYIQACALVDGPTINTIGGHIYRNVRVGTKPT
jgi:hypothetical protein